MSAVVAPLERDSIFWFRTPETGRFHAFELVEGELEPLSVCGKVEIEQCDDVPMLEASERHGRGCTFCLSGVV